MKKAIIIPLVLITISGIFAAFSINGSSVALSGKINTTEEMGSYLLKILKAKDSAEFFKFLLTETDLDKTLNNSTFTAEQKNDIRSQFKKGDYRIKMKENYRKLVSQINANAIDPDKIEIIENEILIKMDHGAQLSRFKYKFKWSGKEFELIGRDILRTPDGLRINTPILLHDRTEEIQLMNKYLIEDSIAAANAAATAYLEQITADSLMKVEMDKAMQAANAQRLHDSIVADSVYRSDKAKMNQNKKKKK